MYLYIFCLRDYTTKIYCFFPEHAVPQNRNQFALQFIYNIRVQEDSVLKILCPLLERNSNNRDSRSLGWLLPSCRWLVTSKFSERR